MLFRSIGYNEHTLPEKSRDLTTFQMLFGALRLVTLPMRWTNSVLIFHDDVTYILQLEMPDITLLFIHNLPIKGPKSRYMDKDGTYKKSWYLSVHLKTLSRVELGHTEDEV